MKDFTVLSLPAYWHAGRDSTCIDTHCILYSTDIYIDCFRSGSLHVFSSNDTLDGTCSVLTFPFQCTDFIVQRIVGR